MKKGVLIGSALVLALAGCSKSGTSTSLTDVAGAQSGGTAATAANVLATTKISDQDSLTVAVTDGSNVMAADMANVQKTISVYVSNNTNATVSDFDGKVVYFMAEGGSMMQNSCTIASGACTVTWRSQNPHAKDGRVTIAYYMRGSETFVDSNANGVLDAGETFTDTTNPYLNRDRYYYKGDCVTETTRTYSDGNATFNEPNSRAKYNYSACVGSNTERNTFKKTDSWADPIGSVANETAASVQAEATESFVTVSSSGYNQITSAAADGKFSGPCADTARCATESEKWIWGDFELVLSYNQVSVKAYQVVATGGCPSTITNAHLSDIATPKLNNETVATGSCVRLDITDPVGNVLSAGTTIEMTGDDFKGIVSKYTVPSTSFPQPFFVTVPSATAKTLEVKVTPKTTGSASEVTFKLTS